MKALGLLLLSGLMLSGCADLLSGRPCSFAQTKISPAVYVKKTPKVVKPAAVIYFADGSAKLTADEKQTLAQVAQKAKKLNADIKIAGHASSRTRPATLVEHTMINLGISSRRAEVVLKSLAQSGVPLHKMRYEALADSQPAEPEVNAKAAALNRRFEVFYIYQE